MLNLDPAKLLVIAVVAIILLGPDRLPQVARQVGAAWRSFNEFRHRMESEVRNTMPDLPSTSEIARLARSPSALLNHLSSMSDSPPSTNGDAEAAVDAAADAAGVGDDVTAPDGADADADASTRVDASWADPSAGNGVSAAVPAPDETGEQDAPVFRAPPPPPVISGQPATPGARDEPLDAPLPAATPTPRLVRPDPEVVAPGDPTLN